MIKNPFAALCVLVLALMVSGSEARAQPEKIANSFAAITKKVEPAVVSIETKTKAQPIVSRGAPAPGGDELMDFLRRQATPRPVRAVGSGFIVDKSGYIVTNAHVVDGVGRIAVKLDSGEEYTARVIGTDEATDLAVLKIDVRRDLPYLKFADSDRAEVGDWVLAIGSPFGLSKTVTAGIISQTRRETPNGSPFQRFIQTDAAINRGNSGGPLVNMDGEVIGVNSQIATSTGDYNGVGFALPAREAGFVLDQILKNGRVRRGYLGVLLESVHAEFAAVYNMKEARGAIVSDVRDKQGPAALAGIKTGDVVTSFNGKPVESALDLIAKVASAPPEQTITLGYLREVGEKIESGTANVRLGERPGAELISDNSSRRTMPIEPKADPKPFGLTLSALTPALGEKYNLETQKGLLVKEVNPTSFIADVKNANGGEALGEGDLIQRINRVGVTDLKTFNDIVAKLKVGDPVVLHVVYFSTSEGLPRNKIVQFTVR